MDGEKEKKLKTWISEGLLIATITAISYLYTFIYETGYASVFGIPQELIELNINRIFYVISILIGIILFFTVWIDLGLRSMKVNISNITPIGRRLLKLIPVVVFLFIYIFLFGIWYWREWIWVLLVFVLYALLEFIFPLINKWGKVSYREKLAAQDKLEQEIDNRSTNLFKLFFTKAEDKIFILFIIFILGWSISYSSGRAVALRQSKYLVLDNFPESIVLRIYGDKMICAPFDRANKSIGEKLFILNMSGERKTIFSYEEIGPLQVKNDKIKIPDTETPVIRKPTKEKLNEKQ